MITTLQIDDDDVAALAMALNQQIALWQEWAEAEWLRPAERKRWQRGLKVSQRLYDRIVKRGDSHV